MTGEARYGFPNKDEKLIAIIRAHRERRFPSVYKRKVRASTKKARNK